MPLKYAFGLIMTCLLS